MITRSIIGDEPEIVAESLAIEDIPNHLPVVDVGGAMCVFPRADYAVDRIPFTQIEKYPPRNLQYPVRAREDKWITADVCNPMTYFADKQFDYSVCSQVVEDVRDPIGLIRELSRISRTGFISTVNLMYELSSFEGAWAGYWHHRWLIGIHDGVLEFVSKPPFLYPCQKNLSRTNRLLHVWWADSISATEVFYDGSPVRDSFVSFLAERWGNAQTGV